jgi:hypothetical protein
MCHKNFSCQSKLITHLNVHNKPSSGSVSSSTSPRSLVESAESPPSNPSLQNADPNLQSMPPPNFIIFDPSYPHQPPPPTRGQLVQYILDQQLHQSRSSSDTTLSTRTLPSGAYPCEICFEIFRKKTLLRTHKLSIHGVAEFRCGEIYLPLFPPIHLTNGSAENCHKIFHRKSKLENHLNHDGLLLPCPVTSSCASLFSQNSSPQIAPVAEVILNVPSSTVMWSFPVSSSCRDIWTNSTRTLPLCQTTPPLLQRIDSPL